MAIIKAGSKLIMGAMERKGKTIAKKIFNLKEHKGERVRVHIDTDGEYSIETKPKQKVLVCELDIPARKYIHTRKVVNGETVVEYKEKELQLGETMVVEYLKEKVEKI